MNCSWLQNYSWLQNRWEFLSLSHKNCRLDEILSFLSVVWKTRHPSIVGNYRRFCKMLHGVTAWRHRLCSSDSVPRFNLTKNFRTSLCNLVPVPSCIFTEILLFHSPPPATATSIRGFDNTRYKVILGWKCIIWLTVATGLWMHLTDKLVGFIAELKFYAFNLTDCAWVEINSLTQRLFVTE